MAQIEARNSRNNVYLCTHVETAKSTSAFKFKDICRINIFTYDHLSDPTI